MNPRRVFQALSAIQAVTAMILVVSWIGASMHMNAEGHIVNFAAFEKWDMTGLYSFMLLLVFWAASALAVALVRVLSPHWRDASTKTWGRRSMGIGGGFLILALGCYILLHL